MYVFIFSSSFFLCVCICLCVTIQRFLENFDELIMLVVSKAASLPYGNFFN